MVSELSVHVQLASGQRCYSRRVPEEELPNSGQRGSREQEKSTRKVRTRDQIYSPGLPLCGSLPPMRPHPRSHSVMTQQVINLWTKIWTSQSPLESPLQGSLHPVKLTTEINHHTFLLEIHGY